jgi:hypothetical protein
MIPRTIQKLIMDTQEKMDADKRSQKEKEEEALRKFFDAEERERQKNQ